MDRLPRNQFRVLFIRIEQTPGHKMLLLCLYTTTEIVETQVISRAKRVKKHLKNNNNYLLKLCIITVRSHIYLYVVPVFGISTIICRAEKSIGGGIFVWYISSARRDSLFFVL